MSTHETVQDVRRRLEGVAANLAYGWRHEMRVPFALIDEQAFDRAQHNPRAALEDTGDATLERAMQQEGFWPTLDAAERALAEETGDGGWWRGDEEATGMHVAYFSSEFGVDESLPIYSGGLGVLAGDHLKSSSELGLPLVGVGLMYRRGYFRQGIDEFGSQIERYPQNRTARLPLTLEKDETGRPIQVQVELAGEAVHAQIWRADVGRVRLYLLDSDMENNNVWGRRVTDSLYGGDREQRIRQELLLGIGGVRALRRLGINPTVWHMNEGHAAFLQFERLRELVQGKGMAFDDAMEKIVANTVFTTHTPVAAGNEVFDPELVERYIGTFVSRLGTTFEQIAELGRSETWGFGMTPFALRTSAYANGVSKLHGEVSRRMWQHLFPDAASADEVPIGSITNGVHARTVFSEELYQELRPLGLTPEAAPDKQGWERVREIDDETLWQVRRNRKERLLQIAKPRFLRQPGSSESQWKFDPDVLTIGFARRFATYKRAGLLFSDPDRLGRMLGDPDRPLQILLAGKAHPADQGGKDLIHQVVAYSRDERSFGRVAFLEDYEIVLARRLVQGVDIWLNTPRRPMEASGTSGMKASMNGGLNVSILDGWWAEGSSPDVGFDIGGDWVDTNDLVQDQADAEALFSVLEDEVMPAYYDRDERGLPPRWLHMMKESIATLGAEFNSSRMVAEYAKKYYVPAHRGARAKAGSASR